MENSLFCLMVSRGWPVASNSISQIKLHNLGKPLIRRLHNSAITPDNTKGIHAVSSSNQTKWILKSSVISSPFTFSISPYITIN